MSDFAEKLQYARTLLALTNPFFGTLAIHIPNRCFTAKEWEHPIPSACTDGKQIMWHEEFVQSLDKKTFAGVLLHEILHIAFMHAVRRGERNPALWNVAADYAINWLIEENRQNNSAIADKLVLPEGGLYDEQYANLSAEEIYNRLPDSLKDKFGQKAIPGTGAGDLIEGALSETEAAEMRQMVAQAATAARMMGRLPEGIARLVEGVLHPKRDWRNMLQEFIEQFPFDWSFARPDRRFHDWDFVMPSMSGEQVSLAVAFDTSGSISSEQLQEFLSEVLGILQAFDHVKLRVLTCDATVHEDVVIEGQADVDVLLEQVKFKGGGGTSFIPVFERLAEEDRPQALVFFTDGDGTYPAEEPDYPVLWILTSDKEPPFGIIARL